MGLEDGSGAYAEVVGRVVYRYEWAVPEGQSCESVGVGWDG